MTMTGSELKATPRGNARILVACVVFVGCMLGVSFASVPLYRLFCQVTGYNGTTQRGLVAPGGTDRQIRVDFDANVNPKLPWKFAPENPSDTIAVGARDISQLSLAAKASYHLVLAWNALAALVFITMRNVIPTFFTTNAEVIAIASNLMVFAALYQLSDGIQNVSVGILRGIQDVKIIMPIAFVSYWLLNLPVGYLFGFTLGMGPSGLFLGFSFGLSAAAVMMILRIRRSIRRLYLNSN